MKTEYKIKEDNLVVYVDSELDHHNAENIKAIIEHYLCTNNIKSIIFDFSKTMFMDSSGIGLLIGRYKILNEIGGNISICNVNKTIDRMFLVSGLYKIIKKYNNIEMALKRRENV